MMIERFLFLLLGLFLILLDHFHIDMNHSPTNVMDSNILQSRIIKEVT